jgi:endoribonuclease Dicer
MLTVERTKLVSNAYLFRLAVDKNLERFLLSCHYCKSKWFGGSLGDCADRIISDKTISDLVECLIGVFYVLGGLESAVRFCSWLGWNNGLIFTDIVNCDGFYFNGCEDLDSEHLSQLRDFSGNILKYAFHRLEILHEARIHGSFYQQSQKSYQRLEYLGDAILDILVTQHIFFTHCENLSCGLLTKVRSLVVCNSTLAKVSVFAGLHPYILCNGNTGNVSLYEQSMCWTNWDMLHSGECSPPKMLADICESIIGAIFSDCGSLLTTWKAVQPFFEPLFKNVDLFVASHPQTKVRLNTSSHKKYN